MSRFQDDETTFLSNLSNLTDSSLSLASTHNHGNHLPLLRRRTFSDVGIKAISVGLHQPQRGYCDPEHFQRWVSRRLAWGCISPSVGANVFFVLLEGTYACRVWPATVTEPSSMPGETSETQRQLLHLDLNDQWIWLTITDARVWYFIPTKWVVSTHKPDRFGHIVAEVLHQSSHHVPLVAEALVQVGHKEKKTFRYKMCTLLPDASAATEPQCSHEGAPNTRAAQHALEVQFMSRLMEGHLLKSEYLQKLRNLHEKQNTRSNKKQTISKHAEDDMDDVEISSDQKMTNMAMQRTVC